MAGLSLVHHQRTLVVRVWFRDCRASFGDREVLPSLSAYTTTRPTLKAVRANSRERCTCCTEHSSALQRHCPLTSGILHR